MGEGNTGIEHSFGHLLAFGRQRISDPAREDFIRRRGYIFAQRSSAGRQQAGVLAWRCFVGGSDAAIGVHRRTDKRK